LAELWQLHLAANWIAAFGRQPSERNFELSLCLAALLEAEARGAASAMGLDASLGVLHSDTPHRDSLALDLLEPARAQVDSYVIDYFLRPPFGRSGSSSSAMGTRG
jgi:CRISPR/Cas system-associated endonuclease Cas1